jgi:hypothetical protein
MRSVLLAVVASMSLVGCVGQLDDMGGTTQPGPVGGGTNPNPTPNSMGKKMFDDNVYPIISDKTSTSGCSMVGCHMVGNTPGSTQFVAATAADGYGTATSYQALVGNFTPASAGILTQVAAGHNGRVFTDAQKQSITDWLNQEVLERGQGGGGTGSGTTSESPGAATARLMNEWSACMNITDFNSANMATAWGQMQTNNGSRCESCHATGGYGMIVTQVAESATGGPPGLFTTIATNKYYTIQYFSVDLTQPGLGTDGKMGRIVINKTSFEGVANNQPPHTEHPNFNADNNQGMTALKSFYDLVSAKVTAGGCGPTKLDPPAQ